MKAIFLITLIVIFEAQCFSGTLADDPRMYPALIVHDKGVGSGCFLQVSNSVYLVTAKHVLFTKVEGTNAPSLQSPVVLVKSYSNAWTTNISERILQMNLTNLLNAGEIRFSKDRDTAVVRFEQFNTKNKDTVEMLPGVISLSKDTGLTVHSQEFTCRISDVDVGADVFMYGYPISLTGQISKMFDPSEPLLRKGVVAGVNLKTKTIIIDCPSYFGNSGGPVVQVEHPSLTETRFRIIGFVSGFVPFQEEWENKTMNYSHVIKSNSGYTVIEPIDIAYELIWK